MKRVNKKPLIIFGAVAFVILLLIAFQNQQSQYTLDDPAKVVRQYFEAWGRKDWSTMYIFLSDGFKKIDHDAGDLASFSIFANSQGIEDVEIRDIQQKANDGSTAVVSYSVEFTLSNGKKQSFNGEFTLRLRAGDQIHGWKLTHPYGPNVDVS